MAEGGIFVKKNAGIYSALAVVLAVVGVSNLPKSSSGNGATARTEAGRGTKSETKAVERNASTAYTACKEIQRRLQPFVQESDRLKWMPPVTCYDPQPLNNPKLNVEPVHFVIATAPNPISTHLPLLFDRITEIIQQAAEDNNYSYDSSWLPWNQDKDYDSRSDELAQEEAEALQEQQPGVIVFRDPSTNSGDSHYEGGLAVFIVAELPTGGINQPQFDNAVAWIQQLGGLPPKGQLRILGPTFSGSLPSLNRAIHSSKLASLETSFVISSGTVSSEKSIDWFNKQLRTADSFETANEGDSVQVDRFCQYIDLQGYSTSHVAFLSEDETAFGAKTETKDSGSNEPCTESGGPTYVYYPRDIATLRSAYEQQAIFNSSKQVSNTNAASTTLREDLSEPANSDHDTVRSYGGQFTPLAQESVLLAITNVLRARKIEFVVLRSTNTMDQIFLSEFLRRSMPEARIVIDGADLLFRRGAEGSSLRGVIIMSTYPLLIWQQDWTSSSDQPMTWGLFSESVRYRLETWHTHRNKSPFVGNGENHRIFGEDLAEGLYIAARGLFPDRTPTDQVPVRIASYAPPAWAQSPEHDDEDQRPATWLTVIGHRQFWPLAVLNSHTLPSSKQESILLPAYQLKGLPIAIAGDAKPMQQLPIEFLVLIILCLFWALLHSTWNARGSISPVPSRFRLAYFAPIPRWQHSVLVAFGSAVVASVAVILAGMSGLVSGDLGYWGWVLGPFPLAVFVLACLACVKNYRLPPITNDCFTAQDSAACRRAALRGFTIFLVLFVLLRLVLALLLTQANRIPAHWRNVHIFSGVSPLLPQLFLAVGLYCWFWFCLRGLALFGDDRPLLPREVELKLPNEELKAGNRKLTLSMFSREEAEQPTEKRAMPIGRFYLGILWSISGIVVVICAIALGGPWLRTLSERLFGVFIFIWLTICISLMLADTAQAWSTWRRLQTLLEYLDRLPLRRTLNALQGLSWRSVWTMSGNVLAERYSLFSRQIEALRHLENQMEEWIPDDLAEAQIQDELQIKIASFQKNEMKDFVNWYVELGDDQVETVEPLRKVQEGIASIAAFVLANILIPSWHSETDSLIFDASRATSKESETNKGPRISANIAPRILAAEEFVALPYVGFIQNILGRIRTIVLGILCLFIATTLAVSSYTFDPLPVLGGIFLTVFIIIGTTLVVIYAGMHRDATLSYITDTSPGELGGEFWRQVFTFGVGPLLGLLTTLFPSITDFVVSWLQPSTQAIK
jgi:hypothetical protein